MKYSLLALILLVLSCAKQKSVLICGDHECINKTEAKQFFEENLTIEVQIISDDKKSSFDLVDLNVGGEAPNIKVFKSKNKKIVRKLSKSEIKMKKEELKIKKEKSKTKLKVVNKDIKLNKKKKDFKKVNKLNTISSYKSSNNKADICLQLKKCDIDSITSYLIKKSNDKDFPNISLRE